MKMKSGRKVYLTKCAGLEPVTLRTVDCSFNPLPDNKILDWSKLKEFADNNFKFDESGRKLPKRVENTVGKGEVARYVFSKGLFPRGVKRCHCVGMG